MPFSLAFVIREILFESYLEIHIQEYSNIGRDNNFRIPDKYPQESCKMVDEGFFDDIFYHLCQTLYFDRVSPNVYSLC